MLIKNNRRTFCLSLISFLDLYKRLDKVGLIRAIEENSHFHVGFRWVLGGSVVLRAYCGWCDIIYDLFSNSNLNINWGSDSCQIQYADMFSIFSSQGELLQFCYSELLLNPVPACWIYVCGVHKTCCGLTLISLTWLLIH